MEQLFFLGVGSAFGEDFAFAEEFEECVLAEGAVLPALDNRLQVVGCDGVGAEVFVEAEGCDFGGQLVRCGFFWGAVCPPTDPAQNVCDGVADGGGDVLEDAFFAALADGSAWRFWDSRRRAPRMTIGN